LPTGNAPSVKKTAVPDNNLDQSSKSMLQLKLHRGLHLGLYVSRGRIQLFQDYHCLDENLIISFEIADSFCKKKKTGRKFEPVCLSLATDLRRCCLQTSPPLFYTAANRFTITTHEARPDDIINYNLVFLRTIGSSGRPGECMTDREIRFVIIAGHESRGAPLKNSAAMITLRIRTPSVFGESNPYGLV
jgi:hypothetical protein